MTEKPKKKPKPAQAGKGDSPRKVDGLKYRRNFEKIFGSQI